MTLRDLGPKATFGLPQEAAAFGTVLLVAVPFAAVPGIGIDLASSLRGMVVLDATNPPLSGGSSPLIREVRENGVAQATSKYLPGCHLVRAFTCVDATVVEASAAGTRPRVGVPIASDDATALTIAAGLVTDAGCDPVVVGGMASATLFQQGGPGWRVHLSAPDLRRRLGLSPS